MRKFEDLTGQTFTKLTVVESIKIDGKTRWKCKCACGNVKIASKSDLKRGRVKSCGCLRKDKSNKNRISTHNDLASGQTERRLRSIFNGMIQRCENKRRKAYKDYGGRGIKVCSEWRNDFASFCEWSVANGYADNLSIDRIDGNGDYSPQNCRWATSLQQNNNRKDNRTIRFNGETHTVSEWSRIVNIGKETIKYRLNSGWPINEVLGAPHQKKSWIHKQPVWFMKRTVVYKDGVLVGVFDSRKDAAKYCGISGGEVSACALGKRKTANGYTFKQYNGTVGDRTGGIGSTN